ncbi:pyrophosphatase PpaX [Clostridium sp. DJ247]|uniref:pyrophosphatase PpaX n=1 Tax=Clostridium sp. DJ247 TaxID=2726188 RepID=UPI0016260818|nr:pyrophosphatase PpaX [Clostridium sp. DJ247]MBC2580989.1 pyrophosphatase PpaX [Clostridium sp. DJ247]
MIKAILFDLDGTLINTNELIIESFNHTFKKLFNKDVPRNEIVKTFGEPLRDAMASYNEEKADLMVSVFREYNEANHDNKATIFRGVREGLEGLKGLGIKLGVVTSKRGNLARRGLNLIGIYDYMDVIVTPEDTKQHKPLAEPALKACELLNVLPQETIMVGDSHNDILCGKNAKCYTCLVNYTALSLKELMRYNPDYTIDSIEELVDICGNFDENKKAI